jgi:coenzyme F420-reducing hydrogenase gamma subunit
VDCSQWWIAVAVISGCVGCMMSLSTRREKSTRLTDA